MSKDHPVPRPFLKWAGGKSQILPLLLQHVPPSFHTYHEPFLGGGALFFALVRLGRIRQAVLADANRELIETYRAVRDHVETIIRLLATYPYDRDFYYRIRAADPTALSPPERAARMIYLNRTCYNGLYRVNRKGQFNVPFGRYKNPRILDAENLRAVARALRHAELLHESFETTLDRAQPGDFVYFDPPYHPVSRTADFTAYHRDGFGPEQQTRLAEIARALAEKGVFVLLSNSATPFILNLYRKGFRIRRIPARRYINRKGPGRTGWEELIIDSGPPQSLSRSSVTPLTAGVPDNPH